MMIYQKQQELHLRQNRQIKVLRKKWHKIKYKKDGTANSITKKGNTTKTSNANKINKSKTTKKSKRQMTE